MSRWSLHEGESYKWLCSLPDGHADALITDPPYSSGGMVRGDRTVGTDAKYVRTERHGVRAEFDGDARDQRSWTMWATLWLSEACRVVRPGGAVALFVDWRQLPALSDAMQAGGWTWRGIVTWDKTERGARPQLGRFRNQAEYVLWGSRGAMSMERDAAVLPGVVRHYHDDTDRHHQTGKPTPVMREIVKLCERGGLILDPFAGSGTTGVAALLEGYRFAGAEFSPHYAEVARQRLADAERGYVRPFGEGDAQVRLVDVGGAR